MKWIVLVVLVVVFAFFAAGVTLSLLSRGEEAASGLQNGRLSPCPDTPNCVCSECKQEQAYVLPLSCEGDPNASWAQAQMAVLDLGGKIAKVENGYLAATFETPLFRFVDDVEMRLDKASGVIHIRSASRVGRSDLGANRERVEAIRSRYRELVTR